MSKLELKIEDGKVLGIDKNILEQNLEFFEEFKRLYSEETIEQRIDAIDKADEKLKSDILNSYALTTLNKGRTIWLELYVEDSMASGFLYKWLYSKSKNGKGFNIFGCRLDSIMFAKPSDFSDMERAAIRTLYEKVIGK